MRELFPHQEEALRFAMGRSRVALFMEMRLGKSAVAIRWAKSRPGVRRILIVGPLSVLPGWEDELREEEVSSEHIHWIEGEPAQRQFIARSFQTGWFLVNYERLRVTPQLSTMPWDVIILDESTRIRNPQAQITKLLLNRFGAVPHRAILSGLPAPETPLDYFCQMSFLSGEFLGFSNYWGFRQRYFIQLGWDWAPRQDTISRIKHGIRSSAVVMSRRKMGIGSQKVYETRYVELPPTIRKAYQEVARDFSFENLATKWSTTRAIWLARLAGGFSPDTQHPELLSSVKIDELVELLKGELKKAPVVIWFRFNLELAAVFHRLRREGITVVAILGATSSQKRRQRRKQFQQGKVRVILVQIKCGQFGLDLSKADTAIYFSNSYALEERSQSEDRIVHPKKSRPLLYVDLAARRTVDEAVVRALRMKRTSADLFRSRLVEEAIRLHQEGDLHEAPRIL